MAGSDFSGHDREENDSTEKSSPTRKADATEQYCSSCGEIIKKEAEICPNCGVRQKGSSAGEKSPAVAALLSFIFTGAGQVYNGQVGKGIGLFALQIINVLLMVVLIGIFTYLATWGYAIYDAHNTATKINEGEVEV